MNKSEFDRVTDMFLERASNIRSSKGKDYQRGMEDVLSNFKITSEKFGISELKVYAVYLDKHLAAIEYFLRTGRMESEPLQSRILDIVNYMLLLNAMCVEYGYIDEEGNNLRKDVDVSLDDKGGAAKLTEQEIVEVMCDFIEDNSGILDSFRGIKEEALSDYVSVWLDKYMSIGSSFAKKTEDQILSDDRHMMCQGTYNDVKSVIHDDISVNPV